MKTLRRALALGLAFAATAALAVPVENLTLDRPVVDQAGVIAADAEAALNAELRAWHAEGLMQGAVVLVDSTDGISDFDYAMQIGKRWQLGDQDRDNGLLLLVAVNDRNLRFITGSGIEGALPDISAKKIIRETITPHFRNGDYAGGVRAGMQAAAARLAADPEVQAEMVAADREANGWENAPRRADADGAWHRVNMRLIALLPILFIILLAMNTLRSRSGRRSQQYRIAHGIFAVVMGSVAGIIVWLGTQIILFALGIALYTCYSVFHDDGARITRRRHRRDDDDDDDDNGFWSGGGFGGGFGSSSDFGSSGGGGFGGGGGYSGGGGSFSGGGAGGSW
ncbi:MAG: TPM domain-containing protein [Cardiobacteriaceae bacterium]|nr:TPM domain-containing protein [Cardiobacteriaceae bacterium]